MENTYVYPNPCSVKCKDRDGECHTICKNYKKYEVIHGIERERERTRKKRISDANEGKYCKYNWKRYF